MFTDEEKNCLLWNFYLKREGILNLFAESFMRRARVRVTKSQKVDASINKYFALNVES